MGKVVVFDYNTDGYRFNAQNYRNMHVNNLYGNTSSAHQLSYESVNHIEQNVHYYDNWHINYDFFYYSVPAYYDFSHEHENT